MAEITVDENSVYVPGWWVCTECTYRLLDATATGGSCPNDKAPIARLTWKRHYDDANEASHHYARQVSELIETLRANKNAT